MSILESQLAEDIMANGITVPVRELKFHPTRRWRFDFAWPDQMVAVEIEGGTWSGGRHNRGTGFESDCDKYNAAALAGWSVLRFTSKHIYNGEAIKTIKKILEKP